MVKKQWGKGGWADDVVGHSSGGGGWGGAPGKWKTHQKKNSEKLRCVSIVLLTVAL